jgi:hypothetical protein
MVGPFAAHMPSGNLSELGVDQRQQAAEGRLVTAPGIVEQPGNSIGAGRL